MADGKITLYTNHACPYAHRAHIVIQELGIPYEEVFIDLNSPREPWYLEINPRGLVPSIKFKSTATGKEEILTESAVIAQFFTDAYPDSLLPASKEGALFRARVNFLADAWTSKVQAYNIALLKAKDKAEAEVKGQEWVEVIKKEIEPLLADAKPFFGGSSKITLVEALLGPFILRMYALAKDGEIVPSSLLEGLDKLPNFSRWAKEVLVNKSVTGIWDEQRIVENTKKRALKMREQAQANGSK